uniref:Fatty acid desaturase N-terminal domain-containing protein n=1 Tax=Panagrolaimus sp. ES5 TaxID=591445 RepID=A0AC34F2I1_9BILA
MAPPSVTQTILASQEEIVRPVKNLPTLEEIKNAIPPHCFEKNAFKSIYFLIQDFVILGIGLRVCLQVHYSVLDMIVDMEVFQIIYG